MRRVKKKKNNYRIYLRPLRILPIHWFFRRRWEDHFRPRFFTFSFGKSVSLSPILNDTYGEIHLRIERSGVFGRLQNSLQ
ncbi:MAG: hypothetical protein RBU29_11845 [bacterium]|nr:hypothetical protein [bacterium]